MKDANGLLTNALTILKDDLESGRYAFNCFKKLQFEGAAFLHTTDVKNAHRRREGAV